MPALPVDHHGQGIFYLAIRFLDHFAHDLTDKRLTDPDRIEDSCRETENSQSLDSAGRIIYPTLGSIEYMAKTKISVTVETYVLERVDRLSDGVSRSEIVERALKRWISERRRRDLESEIAAYYSERYEDERLEDEEWARLSARYLEKSWQ